MHRWSQLFVPTLREAPSDAEVASHKFLMRAGYIRQLAAGIYSYLFLGQRSILKITNIVREEMDKIGQEFFLPALHPREVWEASGRWSVMGDNMFRLKDRKGADLCLGMTHEEIMTEIARKELRSYKQLPQTWYQIQTKFRDEPRPKSGLLRVRQFTMKDSYSFDIDRAGLDKSFDLHYETYRRIFTRCGLKFVVVEADSGSMGGSESREFMVYTDAGEDFVASCAQCDYAANLEKATSKLAPVQDLAPTGDGKPELVHTPGKGAIADVAEFLKVLLSQDIKTVAYMAQRISEDGKKTLEQPVIVFLRGDHSVNETKLLNKIGGGASALRPMQAEELEKYFNGPAGYLGPVGVKPRDKAHLGAWDQPQSATVIMDAALEGRQNMIAGANKMDYHFRNVTPGKDFTATVVADIRNVEAGDACPGCGSPLKLGRAVEIGHIFKLGTKYTESMGARVLDKDGKEVMPIMGCYGIGIERILTSCIEQNNDENGFWLAPSVAPFTVVVVPTNVKDEAMSKAAAEIAATLEKAGYDVVLDDRDERPGVKFKDADLVGIPLRINVGKKLAEGKVEVVRRSTKETTDVTIPEIQDVIAKAIQAETY